MHKHLIIMTIASFRAIVARGLLLSALGAIVACDGDAGAQGPSGTDGADALVSTTTEPPGANCASGGTKVEAGIDANGDGVLDTIEVSSTTYVCNGEQGDGHDSLVLTSAEAPGTNCPFGGTRIDTGLDSNDNAALDPGEINASATSYVCNLGPSGALSPSTGIRVAYKSVTTATTGPISVRFTLKDDRGFPIDVAGVYSVNLAIQPRFSLSYFTKDATTGIVSPLVTYTKTTSAAAPNGQPTMYNPASAGQGTLVENGLGAGDYTYSFPTTSANGAVAVAYDATKLGETHVAWIQVTRQTDLAFTTNANTFFAGNEAKYFIPSGAGTPGSRSIAAQGKCDGCHDKFKAETVASAQFHGGGRVAVDMCNVCHSPARTTNPLANSSSFVHRIHNGENVAAANQFHGIAATYPQDTRNCASCHAGAAQEAQALTNPSTLACNGCHDYVKYDNSAPATCMINGFLARGSDGKPLSCNHVAGPQPETNCVTCHGPSGGFATTRYHKPVAPPDPNNAWNVATGGNSNSNAAWLAGNGFVPTGAHVITYDVKTVDTVADVNDPTIKRPRMLFKLKLKKDGTDVVFLNPSISLDMINGFAGAPSVYFAFAVPQDGKSTPADFNATVSGYLKKIWDNSATGSSAAQLTGPDMNGYYTVVLTGVRIPSTATMLTGGLGYAYSLASAAPLVQTDHPDYPWVANVPADGKAQGGISVPPPNVWKVASGYTGRRAIVDNNKCNSCHGTLGVLPTFHAGQRNDGPTCSFCHTNNRSSAGWSAGSKYFIHAVHAGRKRSVDFTWHAAAAGDGYNEIEFPGTLNHCTTCHVAGTYDFTNATSFAAIPNMTVTTAATGTLDPDPLTNSTYYTVSPYVSPDGVTNYGNAFSYNAASNATTEAAGTTLVISPITAACASCHDTTIAVTHMRQNGGLFYEQRSAALGASAPQEQCMICHGPGRVAAIGVVHQR